MSKVTITIEDTTQGVKTTIEPTYETLAFKLTGGQSALTAAEGYAIIAVNAIRTESKRRDSKLNVIIPRKRRM